MRGSINPLKNEGVKKKTIEMKVEMPSNHPEVVS